jgi:hypothetical protein
MISTTVQAVGEKVWDSKRAAKSAKKDGRTWTGSPVPGFSLSLQIYYDRMAMNYEYTWKTGGSRTTLRLLAGLHRWALELFCCNLGLILWYPWRPVICAECGGSGTVNWKKGIWLVDVGWCFVIDPWFFQASLLGSRNCFRNNICTSSVVRKF